MAGKNAFDELLASFADNSDREALTGLAAKNPELRNGYLRQSDYNRKQDELRNQVELANSWNTWREQNYVDNAFGEGKGATKRELEWHQKVQELEQKLTEGSGDVDWNTFNTYLDKARAEKGLVTQDVLGQEIDKRAAGVKQTVDQSLAGYAHIAINAPRLAIRHYKTFQDELDTEELVGYATKNGFNDLNKAYDAYTADKRTEMSKAEQQRQIEEAEKRGAEKAKAELAAQNPGQNPVDDAGPELGHFERHMRGLDKVEGEQKMPELGRGGIASIAAREWNANAN